MRFIFTTHPGFGHYQPMVPLARTLQSAGHTVAFATARSFHARIIRDGFEHIPAGLEWDEGDIEETVPAIRDVPREQQGQWILENIFIDQSPKQMVPDLIAAAQSWQPDAFISNTYEVGGVMAAEILGLPYANLNISVRWSRTPLKMIIGKYIAALRRQFNLPPDPEMLAYGRYLELCLMPPTWNIPQALGHSHIARLMAHQLLFSRNGQRGLAAKGLMMTGMMAFGKKTGVMTRPQDTEHYITPYPMVAANQPKPEWLQAMPDQPLVYVSLGTVFSRLYPEVFDTMLTALRDEPVNVVMTLGADGDPEKYGPQPANIRLERFVPQDQILPFASLALNHGGNGTVLGPLAQGIPLVLLPLSADQPIISQLALTHGAAVPLPLDVMKLDSGSFPVVDPERLTAEIVRAAVREGLNNGAYRQAAEKLGREMRNLPGLNHTVKLLEEMVCRRAPVTNGREQQVPDAILRPI
jgi:UDP:flavonoid glycosyltransferase YjiC (YdhE family)